MFNVTSLSLWTFLLQVVWKKDDDVITPSGKYKIVIAGAVHTLTISDVDGKDISQYTAMCRGKTSTAKLIIEGGSSSPVTCSILLSWIILHVHSIFYLEGGYRLLYDRF